MKKLLSLVVVLTAIVAMSSCSVDDSNDIEIIKPGDTVILGEKTKKSIY